MPRRCRCRASLTERARRDRSHWVPRSRRARRLPATRGPASRSLPVAMPSAATRRSRSRAELPHAASANESTHERDRGRPQWAAREVLPRALDRGRVTIRIVACAPSPTSRRKGSARRMTTPGSGMATRSIGAAVARAIASRSGPAWETRIVGVAPRAGLARPLRPVRRATRPSRRRASRWRHRPGTGVRQGRGRPGQPHRRSAPRRSRSRPRTIDRRARPAFRDWSGRSPRPSGELAAPGWTRSCRPERARRRGPRRDGGRWHARLGSTVDRCVRSTVDRSSWWGRDGRGGAQAPGSRPQVAGSVGPETAADSKVAISSRIRQALTSRPIASAAPVPSPSRRSSSR